MNFDQLRYFVTTVEQGSYAQASKYLYVTPEAISKSIGELGKELGIVLLEKSGRGIAPSKSGLVVLGFASEILNAVDDLRAYAQSIASNPRQTGVIRLAICAVPYRGNLFDTTTLCSFQKTHPKTTIESFFGSSEACIALLQENVADAAIIPGPYNNDDFTSSLICFSTLALAVGKQHPLASCSSVSASQLNGQPLALPQDIRYVFRMLKKLFDNQQIIPRLTSVPPYQNTLHDFMRENGVILVGSNSELPELFADVTLVPLEPETSFRVPLYYVRRKETSSATESLRKYLAAEAKRKQSAQSLH